MGQHKLSEAARFLNKLDFMRRLATAGAALRNSPARFSVMPPVKRRRSTRGQRKPTWYTKAWTPSRKRDREEAFA